MSKGDVHVFLLQYLEDIDDICLVPQLILVNPKRCKIGRDWTPLVTEEPNVSIDAFFIEIFQIYLLSVVDKEQFYFTKPVFNFL